MVHLVATPKRSKLIHSTEHSVMQREERTRQSEKRLRGDVGGSCDESSLHLLS